MKTKLHYVFFISFFLLTFSISSQQNYWNEANFKEGTQGVSLKNLDDSNYKMYQLDLISLKEQLVGAPIRGQFSGKSNIIVSFPNEAGKIENFRVIEAPVLSQELSMRYPNIKTYLGFSIDNPGTRIRFSVTPLGVNAMTSYTDKATSFLSPTTKISNRQYLVYNRAAKLNTSKSFECLTENTFVPKRENILSNRDANDQILRTLRIAISTTGEYTNFWDDGNAGNGDAQADALAQVVSTLNRSNEVFEVDMAVTFTLVTGIELVYPDAGTDPYTGSFNSELQSTLTSVTGEANYDIGHLFHFGGNNGNAGCIGCVCVDNQKGSGFSSHTFLDNDGGPYMTDFFDIDYVPHEIGHQMGANHTFSHSNEGTGVQSESGSGTTIMGYAGITGSNDVQDHSDPYFHYHSIDQILNNLDVRTCWTSTAIVNNPPVANAGNDYTIPQGTAFILKGASTDADGGDIHTYTWEQIDNGVTTSANFGPTKTTGATWRSRPPSNSPNRYMPILSRVIAGQLTETNPLESVDNSTWETVSTVARSLNFALTVRDRSETNGVGQMPQSSFDTMIVTVEDVTPFTVFTPPTWGQGSTQTVSWVVGQTTNGTINCQNVNILFSSDGGANFSTTLASNTPNDGSQQITVPTIPDTNNALILVEAADNIFYALSDSFTVSNTPDFSFNNTNGDQSACNIDAVSYNFDYLTSNGFSETTTFSAAGNPTGSSVVFTPANLSSDGSFTMDVNGLTGAAVGDYTITVTGTSTSITKNVDVVLSINNGLCSSVANTTFQTSTTGVIFNTISNLNTGKPSGYSDYTAMSTDINRESSYDLTVYANSDGNFQIITYVWIDWNQNCSFDDAGEQYDLGTSANIVNNPTVNSPLSITVPSEALLGNTTMRVTTKYTAPGANQFPTSCENGADAEVEDYTVNVVASLSVGENVFENFNIWPNPNNGEFTVKLNSNSSDTIKINIYDIRGRQVFNNSYNNTSNFNEVINLGNVQSGIYLLNVSDGFRSTTKKIVVD